MSTYDKATGVPDWEQIPTVGFNNLLKMLDDTEFKLKQCAVCFSYYEQGR
jgi:hypothetical protein